ncbi:hypothetical protein, partial [Commensalibacter intestini]
ERGAIGVFFYAFFMGKVMDSTDLLMQMFQYCLGMIPGDIAANIISIVTVVVTVCTLVLRFWKEPQSTSKLYKVWKIIHVLASFKRATPTIKGEIKDGSEINSKS